MVQEKRSRISGLTVVLFILLFLFLISIGEVFSQSVTRNDVPPIKERLFYGGSFGLQFGTVTDIDISPVVGIWLLPRLNIAAGPKYRYYKDRYSGSTGIYGGRVYSEIVLLKDLNNIIPVGLHFGFFLHAEDELLSLESSFWQYQPSSNRLITNTVLAGVGISQPMGVRSSLNMMFLWTLNNAFEDLAFNLYGNPEIRFAVIF
ncbi:MAG TPA: hypothetical protein PLL94_09425 [Bacteroidales bacterium]|jgi:hypothetical protein|nr:MAG: hypothetical protein BWX96_00152 [Bacteroidetes bacterium ADurb.Bin145]HOU01111.1 hypothetical protein [Bacteroidales bacterium]HQK68353.1 hypothetical protein [Bacteroidales bacterium]